MDYSELHRPDRHLKGCRCLLVGKTDPGHEKQQIASFGRKLAQSRLDASVVGELVDDPLPPIVSFVRSGAEPANGPVLATPLASLDTLPGYGKRTGGEGWSGTRTTRMTCCAVCAV